MDNLNLPLLRDVLQTTVSEVWYCEHRMDNSFLHRSFEETETEMQRRRYFPEGICLKPSYNEEMGYGLKFIDECGENAWVHVSRYLMHQWLRQLDLMPPPDIPWENDVVEEFVWKSKRKFKGD